MRKLLVIALLGIFATVLFAADVTGTWKAEVPGRGGNMATNTFVLKQDGAKLTGTVDAGRGGPTEISEGKVEGDTVTFKVVRETPNGKFTSVFKGTVSGSEIKFNRSMEGGQGNFPAVDFVAKKATT
jgi:hypothetical protein